MKPRMAKSRTSHKGVPEIKMAVPEGGSRIHLKESGKQAWAEHQFGCEAWGMHMHTLVKTCELTKRKVCMFHPDGVIPLGEKDAIQCWEDGLHRKWFLGLKKSVSHARTHMCLFKPPLGNKLVIMASVSAGAFVEKLLFPYQSFSVWPPGSRDFPFIPGAVNSTCRKPLSGSLFVAASREME